MKKVFIIFIFIGWSVTYNSCESQSEFDISSEIQIEKIIADSEDGVLYICANNLYPDRYTNINSTCTWIPCPDDPDQYITAPQGAYLWAVYNPYWNDRLLFKACNGTIPDFLPEIEGFAKIDDIHYPRMKWNFMWAHYYVVKRKINNGSWQTVYTYTVPQQGMSNPPDTSYVDTSMRLTTLEGTVYYQVYGKVWNLESPSAPMLSWGGIPQIESLGN